MIIDTFAQIQKMRITGLLLLMLVFTKFAFSQAAKTTLIEPIKTVEPIKMQKQDMLMFQYQFDGLLDFPDSIKYSYLSRGGGVQLMYDHFLSRDGRFSIGVGLGFATHNFFAKAVYPTTYDSLGRGIGSVVPIQNADTVNKQKLVTNFFDFPIEFRFRTMPNEKGHSWKFGVGAKIGYRTNIYTKTVMDNGDKFKNYILKPLSRSRYGVTARVGYGKVSLFGYYSIGKLFYQDRGTELTPYSIGINLALF